jgi:hypothetical protein
VAPPVLQAMETRSSVPELPGDEGENERRDRSPAEPAAAPNLDETGDRVVRASVLLLRAAFPLQRFGLLLDVDWRFSLDAPSLLFEARRVHVEVGLLDKDGLALSV